MGQPAGIALLSVYDKTGIVEFAQGLLDLGWQLYASGGTAKAISDAGLDVKDVSDLVGGSAVLGHRVVTLSRELAAGLLADKTKKQDVAEMAKLGLPIIDLVCVDLYPLEEAIAKPGATKKDILEITDVGGPTLLREAAKGRRIVLSSPNMRSKILSWLKAGRPNEEELLEQLAARAEYEVARYVWASAQYLGGKQISGYFGMQNSPTKYGENPWQTPAAFYADNRVNVDPLGLGEFDHVKGMERSFINMTDIDRLLQTITHIAAGFDKNFGKIPLIAVGVKHGNACGAAVADSPVEAVKKMLTGDTRAIFGGVIMLNSRIDKPIADALLHHAMEYDQTRLLDGVIGPSVSEDALSLLNRNKLRVVTNSTLASLGKTSLDTVRRIRPVRGGFLDQPNYDFILDFKSSELKFHGKITDQQKRDMLLAWAVGSTSNSNTVSIVKNGQLIGNGVGQQDRVGAAQLALTRTTTKFPELKEEDGNITLKVVLDKSKLAGATAYSDSFFPFPDGPELLAKAGIKAILTSSGSVGDEAVIKTLTDNGVNIAMIPDKLARGFFMH